MSESAQAQRRSGGDISGGGGGCARASGDGAFLLDFASAPPRLAWKVARLNQPGEPIQQTALMSRVGFDWISLSSLPAYALLQKRLERWAAGRSAEYLEKIGALLASLSVAATPYRFAGAPRYLPSQQALCAANVAFRAAIYYNQRTMLSVPAWNRFDLESQAGQILHEGLRHVQLKRFGDESEQAESQIRSIVFHVILSEPGEDPEFDFAQALEDFFHRDAAKFRADAEIVRAHFCAANARSADPLQARVALAMIERLRARDCFADPRLTPRNPGPRDVWGRRCFDADRAAFDSDEREASKASAQALRRTEFSVEAARADVRAICEGRVGAEWARAVEGRILRARYFVYFAYAGAASPLVSKSGVEGRLAHDMRRWAEDHERLRALGIQAMLYENRRFLDSLGGFEDIARTFESLASRISVGLRVRDYLEGRLSPANEQERAAIEAALDRLRDEMKALIEAGALLH